VVSFNIFDAVKHETRTNVADALGSAETLMYAYDLAPGSVQCPYHYEYQEEWLLVVEGTVVVRQPEGERTLSRGDLICLPSGPAGAHKVTNQSDAPARTLMWSSAGLPTVSVYPDSNKIGVWPGNKVDALIFLRDTAVEWSHGEPDYET
jgi:uncharacterized cupin superfamily protein